MYVSLNQFHPSIRESIVSASKIFFFFAHKDDLRESAKRNIEVLYYECMSSPFLLFKMYLDTLCKTVFNITDKDNLLIIFSAVKSTWRDFMECSVENCSGLKKRKLRLFFLRDLLNFVFTLFAYRVKTLTNILKTMFIITIEEERISLIVI